MLTSNALIKPSDLDAPSEIFSGAWLQETIKSVGLSNNIPNSVDLKIAAKDLVALASFLIILSLFDWFLTYQAVSTWGIRVEGNSLLKILMMEIGHQQALLYVKGLTIFNALILTVIAKNCKIAKQIISLVCLLYLFGGVLPWIYLLYYQ